LYFFFGFNTAVTISKSSTQKSNAILTVTAVANGTLGDSTSLQYCLDANFELIDIVECVKYTENVDTIFLGMFTEVIDGIVGKPT
jgi:hypothetical protein